MTQKLQPVRGTHDLLPEEAAAHRAVIETARAIGALAGYHEIATPVFEFSEIFHRTLGETSDVVSKETYSFTDRGGESLTLRPEFTASLARAYISNGLQSQLPCKWFYAGAAFRYERPQKGRQRQFHQIGLEYLGCATHHADVELISLAELLLKTLGIGAHITLQLNSLGDAESRSAYRAALVEYLERYKADLSEDSQRRLASNPLRILDSKAEQDQAIIATAPDMHAHFTPASRAFFDAVQQGLSACNIAYTLNPKLVRGLDYYSHSVWEFTTQALGAQGTVLAGGRYDVLIAQMGGTDTPGIGWAAGIERLVALREALQQPAPALSQPRAVILPLCDAADALALKTLQSLHAKAIAAELIATGALAKRLKKADKRGATFAVLIGEEEVANGTLCVRDLRDGTQTHLAPPALIETLG